MQTHDTLMTIAQVAATFAGFTGIVVVLGRRARGDWHVFDRTVIRVLLLNTFGVVFFSFVPDVTASVNMGNAASWRVANGLFASYHLGVLGWGVVQWRRARADPHAQRTLPLAAPRRSAPLLFVGGSSVVLFQFATAAGLAGDWFFFAYLIGLLWVLALSAFFFALLLVDQSDPAAAQAIGADATRDRPIEAGGE